MTTNGATPTQQIEIYGIVFELPAPYGEGHQLTSIEAKVLNQTFAENISNNFRKKVKEAQDAAETEELGEEALEKLRSEFADYADNYAFSERAVRAPVDPVEREARKVAREAIVNALRAKGLTQKDRSSEWMDDNIAMLIEKNPAVREEARRRVAAVREAAASGLVI